MSEKNKITDELMAAWLKNKLMQDVERYAKRGRRFKDLAIDELRERWIARFREFAHGDRSTADERIDLEAEIVLRGEEPPYEVVKSEKQAIIGWVKAISDAVAQNPTMLDKFTDLVDDLTEFKRSMSGPKN